MPSVIETKTEPTSEYSRRLIDGLQISLIAQSGLVEYPYQLVPKNEMLFYQPSYQTGRHPCPPRRFISRPNPLL